MYIFVTDSISTGTNWLLSVCDGVETFLQTFRHRSLRYQTTRQLEGRRFNLTTISVYHLPIRNTTENTHSPYLNMYM